MIRRFQHWLKFGIWCDPLTCSVCKWLAGGETPT